LRRLKLDEKFTKFRALMDEPSRKKLRMDIDEATHKPSRTDSFRQLPAAVNPHTLIPLPILPE
jgi:hypothetical protein